MLLKKYQKQSSEIEPFPFRFIIRFDAMNMSFDE